MRHSQSHWLARLVVVHRRLSRYHWRHPESMVVWEQMGRPTNRRLPDIDWVVAVRGIDTTPEPRMPEWPMVDWMATRDTAVATEPPRTVLVVALHTVLLVGRVSPPNRSSFRGVDWTATLGRTAVPVEHCTHLPIRRHHHRNSKMDSLVFPVPKMPTRLDRQSPANRWWWPPVVHSTHPAGLSALHPNDFLILPRMP